MSESAMFRVASFVVLEYWRNLNRPSVKVCVLSGVATKPNYGKCSYRHKPDKCAKCPYLAVRPIMSLNQEVDDGEGNTEELIDTLADDAIDLADWLDDKRFLLSCPAKLLLIAHKKVKGIALNNADMIYLCKWRKKTQKSLF